jgi:hypothetical protein
MATTSGQQKTARTWQGMVDSNQALLLRKTGHDVGHWVERARAAGLKNDAELRGWMRDEHRVTGYAQYAVSWELFGYPDFMLRDAGGRLEVLKSRAGDPFNRWVRLTAVDQVDGELLDILARALGQNT